MNNGTQEQQKGSCIGSVWLLQTGVNIIMAACWNQSLEVVKSGSYSYITKTGFIHLCIETMQEKL